MAENINNNKLIYNYTSLANKTPITADIFLNDYCNNKCPYCTYARYGSRNGEYIKIEDFKTYVKILQKAGVNGFILTGGGEPTINKDFDKITNWLETENIQYGINTNFNIFKAIKPNFLKVSLDAYDKESYITRRGVDSYETVIENIRKYIEWKKTNSPNTSVGIQILVENIEQVEKFYNAHRNLEVDYMNFRPMESVMHSYYNTHNSTEIVRLLESLKKQDERVCVNYKWYSIYDSFAKCYAHFTQVALNQRGEVIYCCHKPYEIIGHITDPKIWEKIKNSKTNMNMCDVPCRLTGPNKFMREIEKGCKDIMFI